MNASHEPVCREILRFIRRTLPIEISRSEVHCLAEKDISEVLSEKGVEIKKMFKEMKANLETWKFSLEDTKEGIRVEVHAAALVKRQKSN